MINSHFSPNARRAPVLPADLPQTANAPQIDGANPTPTGDNITRADDRADQARLTGRDWLIAAVFAVAICVLIVALKPFANAPMNDDFSYARTAEALARTGHVVYNGWGSPLLWPQMAYGAFVVKLWGFSWTNLALTGVVLAGVVAGLFYLTLRACRIAPPVAALGVAALTLNPIYLCVAPTFMTDIPSLALLLAPLLLLVRALKRDAQTGLLTLRAGRYLLASVLAIVAGSNRQISWVAFLGAQLTLLALLPPAERKKILLGVGILLDGAIIANYWFALQPYTINVDMQEGVRQLLKYPQETASYISRFLNLLGLLALPLALLALPTLLKDEGGRMKDEKGKQANLGRKTLKFHPSSFILHPLSLTTAFWLATVAMPWSERIALPRFGVFSYGQYFTARGALVGGAPGFSTREVVLPDPLIGLMLLGGAFALAVVTLLFVRWGRAAWVRRGAQSANLPIPYVAACALMAASVVQIVASVPWYSQIFIFDRYLLLLLPGPLALLGMAITQNQRSDAAPRVIRSQTLQIASFTAAAFLATLGVLFAQEYFAYSRARGELHRFLVSQGVRPQWIDGGFELNADAQVQARGYINNAFLVDPKGAFDPNRKAAHISLMPENFPDVDPFYRLSSYSTVDPTEDIFPTPVRVVRYRSWLPPFERKMYIYRVKR